MASKRNSINQLRNKINQSKDHYLEKITKVINQATKTVNPEDWSIEDGIYYNEIYQLFYSSFEETYKITSIGLKSIYKEVPNFTVENLLDLTYKTDGKTFEERLRTYWQEAYQRLKDNQENLETSIWLIDKYNRILETETRIIESKVKDNKKPIKASLIVIDSGCDACQGGEFAIDEDIELPPYHPNCQCNWWYEETDNPDDIIDIDLEVEE